MRGRTALFVPARWKGGGLKENCSCSSCSCSSYSCSCSCSCSSAPARLKTKNEGGWRPAGDPPATRQQPVSNPPAIRVAKSANFFFALRANAQFCCSHFWRLASNPPAIRVAKSANFSSRFARNVQFCRSHFWRPISNPPATRVAKSANFFFALCAKCSVLSFALLDIRFCHDLLK